MCVVDVDNIGPLGGPAAKPDGTNPAFALASTQWLWQFQATVSLIL
jgi:hypothetical protein